MPRTKTKETPRPRDPPDKPILRKSADGTPMRAPKGVPLLMSSTYASPAAAPGTSTRELVRHTLECTVEEDADEGTKDEDSEEWIASYLWETDAELRAHKPLSFYKDFITAPAGQKWRLILVVEWPACCDHNESNFFFYGAPLKIMGVRIPLSGFHKGILDWLLVAPSQLHPNAWGFIRCFEMVMEYLGRTPTAKVFFCFFNVFHSLEKGSRGRRQVHVGLRCNPLHSIFIPANDSNKDYKVNFFV